MAGNAPSHRSSEDNGGIRRRNSGQESLSDVVTRQNARGQTGTTTIRNHPPTRSASDPDSAIRKMSSTGSDAHPATTPAPSDHPRVRFSTDVQRRPSLPKAKYSDETVHRLAQSSKQQRPGTPDLSIDTKAATSERSVLGETLQSPQTITSSADQTKRGRSPLSPHGRHRGLSLRSSLFQKSFRDHSRDGESVIEMHEVGPKDESGSAHHHSGQTSEKKSMDSKVRVTPVDDSGEGSSDQKGHDLHGGLEIHRSAALPNYYSWLQKRASRNTVWRRSKVFYNKARKFVLRINEIPPSKDGRHIDLEPFRNATPNDERTGKPYVPNTVRSSRYTAYNFLPRQLFAQFSKLANFYFLTVSILQMIPGLSTTGTYTTIIPLLIFVSIAMGKEGYDDYRRYRQDQVENNQEATVLSNRPSKDDVELGDTMIWSNKKWHELQVGEIIRLKRDDAVPADIILLHSKGENNVANIETMALDGETNLKSKQVPQALAKICPSLESALSCGARFVVEDPNLDLYNFEGKVVFNGKTSPVTNNEVIYRGSILRNTPCAYGMVIYTGEECKIRMNANKNPRIKAPSMQAVVNKVVIVIVIFVIALAIFNTVAYQVWRSEVENKSWYLSDATVAFFPILVSFIIMFNTMIPLSLYVSLEIVHVAQMLLLNDIDMYDEASNTPFEARTSTINEELGQISYIFSDKTGTLTENVMKFRKLSVAGTAWLHDLDLQQAANGEDLLLHKKRKPKKKSKGKKALNRLSASAIPTHEYSPDSGLQGIHDNEPVSSTLPRKSTSGWQSSARPDKPQPELSTTEMIRYIQRRPHTVFARKARMFLLSIALCHTCLPEKQEDGRIEFQASSPDELALISAAQELGYLAYNRDSNILSIKTLPQGRGSDPVVEEYEVLDIIEFSSKRKRMSVIVRFPDGRIAVLCKGADTILMSRLRLAGLAEQKVSEIEERVSKRQSLEAREALRRKSEAVETPVMDRRSFSRASLNLTRRSVGGIGRASTSAKLEPIRDELDNWLTEREHDVSAPQEDLTEYYTPRPSIHVSGKPSMAISEARSSYELDDDEDEELVEEALAVDESTVIERCFQHINDFATEGLRTLLYGHRFLDEQEYESWKKIYADATTSFTNRQMLIEKAGELIEQSLELGGATAIEDKLQHGVPEAIDKLRRAHIKMWMLTGDKRETAINIGHSCRLIKDYSSVTILDHTAGQLEQRIAAATLDVQSGNVAHSVIVVDGGTLAVIEAQPELHTLFLDLAISADSVICCRASPSQKAGLVHSIRRRIKNSVTLAIGDGANDIAMIQEAHVGIGITGREGLQAARSSDYSIAQFRFLTKLLLVHGRWNYIRVSKYVVGTFWKEAMFYLVQAVYQRYAGYTGTSLYESWSLSMFNTLFTSLCVIFLGIFEKDLQASTLLAVPELYSKGQRNGGFNFRIYLGWMFMAASEAMIIFFTMWGLLGMNSDNDLFAMGDLCFSAAVIFVNIKLQVLEVHNKSIMALICVVVEVGGWWLWNILLALIYTNNVIYRVKGSFFTGFGQNVSWWAAVGLLLVALIYFEITVRSLKAAYWPSDVDTFQCLEQDLEIRKRFEEASALELQAGWHRGSKKSSIELAREMEEEAKRSKEVEDLLNRPRVMEEGRGKRRDVVSEEERVVAEDEGPFARKSTDVHEMLSRRFGKVKQDTMFPS